MKCRFLWEKITLCHVVNVLEQLLPSVNLSISSFQYDYDAASAAYLERKPIDLVTPVCNAMFIDEAQDMGPNTLRLLSALVTPSDSDNSRSRAMNIFYDNAQNIYGRGTPTWSELGLDMRGRSTVMKESFRSTKPITEFALNVLYQLQPPTTDPDHKELIERGLIEQTERQGAAWWEVRFNQIDGPLPIFKIYDQIEKEFYAIANQLLRWIRDEGVKPSDICILYNGQNIPKLIERLVTPQLQAIGAGIRSIRDAAAGSDERKVLLSTSHSFKGYDAEVVVIAGADQFVAAGTRILANNLYVAMTRARSVLAIYGKRSNSEAPRRLTTIMEQCYDAILRRPTVDIQVSKQDDFENLLAAIGDEHRAWLGGIWKKYDIQQEPILSDEGEILAEPVLWFRNKTTIIACFGKDAPSAKARFALEDMDATILVPGAEWLSEEGKQPRREQVSGDTSDRPLFDGQLDVDREIDAPRSPAEPIRPTFVPPKPPPSSGPTSHPRSLGRRTQFIPTEEDTSLILRAIDKAGEPSGVPMIAAKTHIDPVRLKQILPILVGQGKLRQVGNRYARP